MPCCLWCISNKATRSDDEDGSDTIAGPSKSKKSISSETASRINQNQVHVQIPPPESKSPDELFNAYSDEQQPDVIGPEGLETLCTDAEIPMEGARPLLLAWQLDAKEMGSITRAEWKRGLEELKINNLQSLSTVLSDLEDLLVLRHPPPKRPASSSVSKGTKQNAVLYSVDRYKKDKYWGYAANVGSAFQKFYGFCFALAKKEGSRNIEMEMASAFWSVILAPTYPIMSEILEFINEKATYKGVNKDLWTMMEEFCRTVQPSLEGYENDGAWPTLLDDFVAWRKERDGGDGAKA